MIKLKILLKSKKFIIILIFLAILSFTSFKLKRKTSIYKETEENFVCTVTDIYQDNSLKLNCNEEMVGRINSIDNIEIGDILKIKGTLKEFNRQSNFNLFDYKTYQENLGIFFQIDIESFKKVSKTRDIVLQSKNYLNKRILNLKSYSYLKALILGEKKEIDDNIISSFKSNGVIHLFSISGMHISLLIELIDKTYKKNNNKRNIFTILFLVFYYNLIKSISLFRCLIFFITKKINELLDLKFTKSKLFLIDVLLIVILKANYLYSIGFYYSIIISIGISYSTKYLKNKSKIMKSLIISLVAFILAIPLNIYSNFEINFLSIFNNIVFVPFVSFIIFPLSLLTFLVPYLDNVLVIFTKALEDLSLFLNNYQITLIFKKIDIYVIAIYYLVIFLSFYNKRLIYLLLLLLLFHYNYNDIIKENYVLVLDVGQGDSSLLHLEDTNILIDTGGRYGFNITENITIPVLKSFGIRNIDYLILTHGDYDHLGESINLINNFKVDKVILNCGEINELEKDLIEVLNKRNIKYYSCIDKINLKNNSLYFLRNNSYDNENDNSNIIYTEVNGYKLLFMGDASKEVESDLLNKYSLKDIDILKVGHHGSKTSSSKDFIDRVEPKYSVISVGKNNIYGHPNSETLNNLNKSLVYRTDESGSIFFNLDKKIAINTAIS